MLRERVAANPLWYHTIELEPGLVTSGWFDLRPVVDRLPWPDVRGKRCLDVGTYDGFLAFELERRGAGEVVATDIGGHEGWDWPHELRSRGPAYLAALAGPKGNGFEIAHEALVEGAEVDARGPRNHFPHVPHVPSVHEESTATPASSTTCSTDLSGGTGGGSPRLLPWRSRASAISSSAADSSR